MDDQLELQRICLGLSCLSNKYRMMIFQKLKLLGEARMSEFEDYGTKNHQKFYNNMYQLKKRKLIRFEYNTDGEVILKINHDFTKDIIEYIG